MLARMRRPYTASAYATMVERIHRLMPHASIGTDLIVGFPGETDAEADETARVVSALPLSHLHVFPYSHREGTEASGLNGLPDGAAVRARAQRLREIGAALTARFKASQIGAVRRALVVDDGQAVVTDNYLKLRLDTREPRNTWVRVRVGEQGRGVVLPPAPPAAESA
jgi:threonylcarbamoyladenosine tRNA methylthiotransferase MtaB